jgi:hypothetical protein
MKRSSKLWMLYWGVMQTITQDWGMTTNGTELGSAVHVIQGFIVQHMLHRLAPEEWSGWHA